MGKGSLEGSSVQFVTGGGAATGCAADKGEAIVEPCQVACQSFDEQAGIGEITLKAPECALRVCPGQFVQLQLPGLEAHLLRRPFSVYKADAQIGTISLLFQAAGDATHHMSILTTGAEMNIIGPIGRGWQPYGAEHCLLIGGGVGAAPLYLLASELAVQGAEVEVILGATTKALLVCADAYEELLGAKRVHLTTDDGSRGFKGFTTERAVELLAARSYDYIATCGPELMQRAVAELATATGITAEVSLERRMACGIGACLSCVVDTREGKKRACIDGPVFDAQEVCW